MFGTSTPLLTAGVPKRRHRRSRMNLPRVNFPLQYHRQYAANVRAPPRRDRFAVQERAL